MINDTTRAIMDKESKLNDDINYREMITTLFDAAMKERFGLDYNPETNRYTDSEGDIVVHPLYCNFIEKSKYVLRHLLNDDSTAEIEVLRKLGYSEQLISILAAKTVKEEFATAEEFMQKFGCSKIFIRRHKATIEACLNTMFERFYQVNKDTLFELENCIEAVRDEDDERYEKFYKEMMESVEVTENAKT